MNAASHEIEQYKTAAAEDGREIVIWRTGKDVVGEGAPAVLVLPGFARRMRHMAAIALYLAEAGFSVYRCDYLDHVGLSAGSIQRFTMTSMFEAQAAALEFVLQRERRDVVMVAASLANRTALRLAARAAGVAGVIGIVGVVNSRRTLGMVFGEDYAAYRPKDLPDHVVFENRRIDGMNWYLDWHAGGWVGLEGTVQDLRAARCPVTNFCGTSDAWVALADVEQAFSEGSGGPRRLIELPYVEHELSSNPIAAQMLVREVVREAFAQVGAEDRDGALEPSFAQVAEQIMYERSFEADVEATARAGLPSPS